MNLKKQAKGRQCQIRTDVCNKNPETVVLCHIHKPSLVGGGTGKKPDDIFGAHGCSACHDFVDGRTGKTTIFVRLQFLYEGCFRTMKILLDEEIIKF